MSHKHHKTESVRDQERLFASPVATAIDELVSLRELALALNRRQRRARTQASGASASRSLGRGLDFAEVRGYQSGDDVRMIDWNVTARTGAAHTKLFIEERERPYFLVVDLRAGMQFGTRQQFKSALAARLAAIVGWCAIAANDRVGGLVFNDSRHIEVKPQSGRRGLMALFRAIEVAQGGAVAHSGAGTLSSQFSRLRQLVHTGSSVCVLSDFDGFDARAEAAFGWILKHGDVVAAMISDPLEHTLPPPGFYTLSGGGEHLAIATHGERVRRYYEHRQQQKVAFIDSFFTRRRGRFVSVSTDMRLNDSAARLLAATQVQR